MDGPREIHDHFRVTSHAEPTFGKVFAPEQVRFGYAKSETLPGYCWRCEFLADCWGEVPEEPAAAVAARRAGAQLPERRAQAVFAHAVPEAARIAARLNKGQIVPAPWR